MMASHKPKAEPFFEEFPLFERANDREHYGPPFFQQAKSGTIIATAPKQGARWRDAGRKVVRVTKRSTDGGRTWTLDERNPGNGQVYDHVTQVIDHVTGDVFSLRKTSWPMRDDQGRLMTEAWMIKNFDKGREMGARMSLARSRDDGRTWIEEDVTDQFYTYPGAGLAWFIGHGIQLQRGPHKGRLIIPARYFTGQWQEIDPNVHNILRRCDGLGVVYDDGQGPISQTVGANAHNTLVYSDDHGETWHWGGSSQGYSGEACVVELSDGTVYINNRNHDPKTLGYRSWAISRDGGETFTEFGVDKTLVEGRCHASIARYCFPEEGHLGRILFLNPAVFEGTRQGLGPRHHMTVRVSYDDGVT